ncbi:1,4-alpha-glucan branching protein [Nocardia sp. NPDC050710]|uniref:maltokinase N-terminal cap-like domain-containing protein n=1 Tax=Nocardia sp. NPDC050710 TaxID=3157220 RepID=UPI0033EB253C
MAVIHRTTMSPGKLDLLTEWLPTRPWYCGTGVPRLRKAGGFRLDDPAGVVGMEFMVVADGPVAYHLPLTYRGAPLDSAADGLVGTSIHGVLGQRWIYDGTRDPVLLAQSIAMLTGRAEPQAQSESDTPDPSVEITAADYPLLPAGFDAMGAVEGADHTEITVDFAMLRIHRVLVPSVVGATTGVVTAPWTGSDGGVARGIFLSLRS